MTEAEARMIEKERKMIYETQDGYHFNDIQAAKKHIESIPYYSEAISKNGLIQTVWDAEGDPICSRQIVVNGIGSNCTVSVGSWYDY